MEGGCSKTSKILFNGVPSHAYLTIFADEQDNLTLVNNLIASNVDYPGLVSVLDNLCDLHFTYSLHNT